MDAESLELSDVFFIIIASRLRSRKEGLVCIVFDYFLMISHYTSVKMAQGLDGFVDSSCVLLVDCSISRNYCTQVQWSTTSFVFIDEDG